MKLFEFVDLTNWLEQLPQRVLKRIRPFLILKINWLESEHSIEIQPFFRAIIMCKSKKCGNLSCLWYFGLFIFSLVYLALYYSDIFVVIYFNTCVDSCNQLVDIFLFMYIIFECIDNCWSSCLRSNSRWINSKVLIVPFLEIIHWVFLFLLVPCFLPIRSPMPRLVTLIHGPL